MSELMDAYWRLPPVSRTLATAAFVTSIGVYGGLISFQWFYFDQRLLFKLPPEIWRIFTAYLLTMPKLSIILDPYFLYSYGSQLEVGNPRMTRREDFVWYITFVCLFILLIDNLTGFHTGQYLQGLILALAYTCTQDQRGVKANFFFITIPAQLVPYSMMLVSFLMVSPYVALVQLWGLLAAHCYDFLTRLWPEFGGGANLLPTPAFFSRLTPTPNAAVQQRSYGTAIRTGGSGSTGAAASGSSSGSGPLPDAWRTRGRGQRLGGD